ncbi:hypothetical protein HMPREF9402_1862 [Turicibacter sp. HGF1]|uniref:TetR/AcrR family transcriptional regulator n=1 Tax=Turicibacter sp. HGF1 TaxID=910310 RepID=UPI0001FDB2EB|nr:TetR/AcrR family transcriptional regulator [Turicibacter sp. HGF1]EGC93008.1 hypothetical protein HMPREF9402_1862 [Turicibacter sp. HGF1]
MKPKLEDRRVRRTKKLLKESFIELMSEKQIKDITVKDLTEHADLNRGTFYLHYLDIYDLLNQLEDEVIENVSMMIQDFNFRNSNQSTYLLLEQLFEYIYDNKHILKTFLRSHSQGHFFNKIQLLIKTIGLDTLKNLYQESDSIEYTLFLSFVSNGVIGVTEQWISDGMTLTPKEMALLIDNIINHGARILIQK